MKRLVFLFLGFCFVLSAGMLSGFSLYLEDDALIEKKQFEADNTLYFTQYTERIVQDKKEKYSEEEGIKSYWLENYLDLWYGLTDKINLRLALPFDWWSYEYNDTTTNPPEIIKVNQGESGLSDARLGLKLRVIDNLAIYTGLKFNNASEDKGLGTGVNEPFINVIYKLTPVKSLDLSAIAGWQYNDRDKNSAYIYGLILNYCLTEKFEICLESFLERKEGSYNMLSVAPGITYQVTENFYAGLGCQLPVMITAEAKEDSYAFMPYLGLFFVK